MKVLIRILAVVVAALAVTVGLSGNANAADHLMHTGDAFGSVFGWSGKGWFNSTATWSPSATTTQTAAR